ncbi:MAG: hypothetical protein ACRDNS_22085, partial [Trebonia sp.]
ERTRLYKSQRGKGGFVRAGRPEVAYLIIWGTNLPIIRTPDAPFMSQFMRSESRIPATMPSPVCKNDGCTAVGRKSRRVT